MLNQNCIVDDSDRLNLIPCNTRICYFFTMPYLKSILTRIYSKNQASLIVSDITKYLTAECRFTSYYIIRRDSGFKSRTSHLS